MYVRFYLSKSSIFIGLQRERFFVTTEDSRSQPPTNKGIYAVHRDVAEKDNWSLTRANTFEMFLDAKAPEGAMKVTENTYVWKNGPDCGWMPKSVKVAEYKREAMAYRSINRDNIDLSPDGDDKGDPLMTGEIIGYDPSYTNACVRIVDGHDSFIGRLVNISCERVQFV